MLRRQLANTSLFSLPCQAPLLGLVPEDAYSPSDLTLSIPERHRTHTHLHFLAIEGTRVKVHRLPAADHLTAQRTRQGSLTWSEQVTMFIVCWEECPTLRERYVGNVR
jgi:hypothetical protein